AWVPFGVVRRVEGRPAIEQHHPRPIGRFRAEPYRVARGPPERPDPVGAASQGARCLAVARPCPIIYRVLGRFYLATKGGPGGEHAGWWARATGVACPARRSGGGRDPAGAGPARVRPVPRRTHPAQPRPEL